MERGTEGSGRGLTWRYSFAICPEGLGETTNPVRTVSHGTVIWNGDRPTLEWENWHHEGDVNFC